MRISDWSSYVCSSDLFDAAHHFPNEPDGSPYRRMHGHSFSVEATVRGEALDGHGWVADLGALDRALKAAAEELDHGLLNDKPGLEMPTLEHLCLWRSEESRGGKECVMKVNNRG